AHSWPSSGGPPTSMNTGASREAAGQITVARTPVRGSSPCHIPPLVAWLRLSFAISRLYSWKPASVSARTTWSGSATQACSSARHLISPRRSSSFRGRMGGSRSRLAVGDRGVDGGLRTEAVEQHGGPVRRERARHAETDAARRAGHDRHPIFFNVRPFTGVVCHGGHRTTAGHRSPLDLGPTARC